MTSRRSRSARQHLSIGEVLSLLKEDFADITISKIRFLESQGLLDPERTPSGYRKFYEADIERLRWILTQQRDNFLPLKVIKDRLAAGELDIPEPAQPSGAKASTGAKKRAATTPKQSSSPKTATSTKPVREPIAAGEPPAPPPPPPAPPAFTLDTGTTAASLSIEELAQATGLSERQIAELEGYGLLEARVLGEIRYYDEDALTLGRLCQRLWDKGIEPRHLRMYVIAAQREAGVYEQLLLPLLHQRRTGSRQEALDVLAEVVGVGEQLHRALVRRSLRETLRPV